MKMGNRLGSLMNLIGIFSAFLLVTVFSVYFYSPVVETNAMDVRESSTQLDISLNITTKLNAAISANNVVMSGFPGDVVTSDPIRIYAFTNNYRGFIAFLNDADSDTSLRSSTSSDVVISKTPTAAEIMPLAESDNPYELYSYLHDLSLQSNLGENEWGVSNSYSKYFFNYLFNEDNEYVVPLTPYLDYSDLENADEDSEFFLMFSLMMMTYVSSTELEANTDYHSQLLGGSNAWCYTDENKNSYEDITFTAHIGSHLTAGEYSDDVVFTVIPTDAILMIED